MRAEADGKHCRIDRYDATDPSVDRNDRYGNGRRTSGVDHHRAVDDRNDGNDDDSHNHNHNHDGNGKRDRNLLTEES